MNESEAGAVLLVALLVAALLVGWWLIHRLWVVHLHATGRRRADLPCPDASTRRGE